MHPAKNAVRPRRAIADICGYRYVCSSRGEGSSRHCHVMDDRNLDMASDREDSSRGSSSGSSSSGSEESGSEHSSPSRSVAYIARCNERRSNQERRTQELRLAMGVPQKKSSSSTTMRIVRANDAAPQKRPASVSSASASGQRPSLSRVENRPRKKLPARGERENLQENNREEGTPKKRVGAQSRLMGLLGSVSSLVKGRGSRSGESPGSRESNSSTDHVVESPSKTLIDFQSSESFRDWAGQRVQLGLRVKAKYDDNWYGGTIVEVRLSLDGPVKIRIRCDDGDDDIVTEFPILDPSPTDVVIDDAGNGDHDASHVRASDEVCELFRRSGDGDGNGDAGECAEDGNGNGEIGEVELFESASSILRKAFRSPENLLKTAMKPLMDLVRDGILTDHDFDIYKSTARGRVSQLIEANLLNCYGSLGEKRALELEVVNLQAKLAERVVSTSATPSVAADGNVSDSAEHDALAATESPNVADELTGASESKTAAEPANANADQAKAPTDSESSGASTAQNRTTALIERLRAKVASLAKDLQSERGIGRLMVASFAEQKAMIDEQKATIDSLISQLNRQRNPSSNRPFLGGFDDDDGGSDDEIDPKVELQIRQKQLEREKQAAAIEGLRDELREMRARVLQLVSQRNEVHALLGVDPPKNEEDEEKVQSAIRRLVFLLDLAKIGSLRGVNFARSGALLSGLIAVLESGSEDNKYLGMMAVEVYNAVPDELEGAQFRCDGEVRNGFVLATEMYTGAGIGGLQSQFPGNEVIVKLAESDDYLLIGYWLNEVVKSTGSVGRHNAMLFIYSKGQDSQPLHRVFSEFKGFDRILHATS